MNTSHFTERIAKYTTQEAKLKQETAVLSWTRIFVIILSSFAFYFGANNPNGLIFRLTGLVLLFFFFVLIGIHQKRKKKLKLATTLRKVNERELAFVLDGANEFDNGAEFEEINHLYSFDLDILGKGSLYQHLNRTYTALGKRKLAETILHRASDQTILDRHQAIHELSNKLDWRQQFQAFAELGNDDPKVLSLIINWTNTKNRIHLLTRIFSYILPAIGASLMFALLITAESKWFTYSIFVYVLNLLVLGTELKNITTELGKIDRIRDTFYSYSSLLKLVENEHWKSNKLIALKERITQSNSSASSSLAKLSRIYGNLESIQNGFVALNFNGTILFHIHVYAKLLAWKKQHAQQVSEWIEILAEFEVLNSLANFASNNPEYCYPEISNNRSYVFEGLGHPLLAKSKRVNNSLDLSSQPFVVLTGSNMSGKSTFLRTIGLATVLGNAGSVIPAKKAIFHPIDLIVSMRLNDSLLDSESYFFAEVKRLQQIVEQLTQKECFVLLDEILRGTNSDDKREGTIAVVERLVKEKAIGLIATHDLEVCETSDKFPDYLKNACFEVEIKNEELHFDYLLRPGICQNKSATFIMKKLNVI